MLSPPAHCLLWVFFGFIGKAVFMIEDFLKINKEIQPRERHERSAADMAERYEVWDSLLLKPDLFSSFWVFFPFLMRLYRVFYRKKKKKKTE